LLPPHIESQSSVGLSYRSLLMYLDLFWHIWCTWLCVRFSLKKKGLSPHSTSIGLFLPHLPSLHPHHPFLRPLMLLVHSFHLEPRYIAVSFFFQTQINSKIHTQKIKKKSHLWMHIHIYIYDIYTHNIYIYMYMYICMYIYMFVYIHIYTYMYTYIYIYINIYQ